MRGRCWLRLDLAEKAFGPDHPETMAVRRPLGDALERLGDWLHAAQLDERAVAIREALQGEDHPDLAAELAAMGRVMESWATWTAPGGAMSGPGRSLRAITGRSIQT